MPPIQVKRSTRAFGACENPDRELGETGSLQPVTAKEGLRRSLLEPVSVSLSPARVGPIGFFPKQELPKVSNEKLPKLSSKEFRPGESFPVSFGRESLEFSHHDPESSLARGVQGSVVGLGGPMMVGLTLMGLLSFLRRKSKPPLQLTAVENEKPIRVGYEPRRGWMQRLSPYHLKEGIYYLKSDLAHYGLLGALGVAIILFGVGINVFNEIARGFFKVKRRTKGALRFFRDKFTRPQPFFDSPSGPDLLTSPYRVKGQLAPYFGEKDLVRRAQYLRRRLHSWDRIKNEKELEAVAEEYFDILFRIPVGHPEFQLGLHVLNRLTKDCKKMAASDWQREYKVRRFGPQVQLPVLRILRRLYEPYVEKRLPRTVMLRALETLKVLGQKKVFVWATQDRERLEEYWALYGTLAKLLPEEHNEVLKTQRKIYKNYGKNWKFK